MNHYRSLIRTTNSFWSLPLIIRKPLLFLIVRKSHYQRRRHHHHHHQQRQLERQRSPPNLPRNKTSFNPSNPWTMPTSLTSTNPATIEQTAQPMVVFSCSTPTLVLDACRSSHDWLPVIVVSGVSTLDDPTTRDSATSASTSSLNDGTWTDSASTLTNKQTRESTSRPTTRVTVKPKNDSSEDKQVTPSRPNAYQAVKRQRRLIPGKNHRRLLQYELMPTGKVYYVDRPVPNESRPNKTEQEENSSVMLSTILSRSSSLDTLSDKRYRHRQQDRSHPQSSLKTTEEKLSIGGRLASNHNLAGTSTSPFKPINSHKKRFSSFEPTPESLDRVFDVLIAADKRREEHDFWKEKFDPRTTSTRVPLVNTGRSQDATHSNTIPFLRNKPTPLHANAATTTNRTSTAPRSQSYTNQRATVYESFNRPPGCLLEDCLRRRTLILQQQQLPQRNYSPNTVYSTTYPKAQLPPTGKPPLPTSTANSSQPVRILPISNGRLARAPQARQTSDELSSTSDVWATRSSLEEETPPGRKVARYPTRFPSAVNRSRAGELRESNSKRASSVEQQKHPQTQQKTHSGKSKFLDLFKFNR